MTRLGRQREGETDATQPKTGNYSQPIDSIPTPEMAPGAVAEIDPSTKHGSNLLNLIRQSGFDFHLTFYLSFLSSAKASPPPPPPLPFLQVTSMESKQPTFVSAERGASGGQSILAAGKRYRTEAPPAGRRPSLTSGKLQVKKKRPATNERNPNVRAAH